MNPHQQGVIYPTWKPSLEGGGTYCFPSFLDGVPTDWSLLRFLNHCRKFCKPLLIMLVKNFILIAPNLSSTDFIRDYRLQRVVQAPTTLVFLSKFEPSHTFHYLSNRGAECVRQRTLTNSIEKEFKQKGFLPNPWRLLGHQSYFSRHPWLTWTCTVYRRRSWGGYQA